MINNCLSERKINKKGKNITSNCTCFTNSWYKRLSNYGILLFIGIIMDGLE